MGEQVGRRPYSKGHGPIGAPRSGLIWQGELEAFVNGVSPGAADEPLVCPSTLIGTDPFPPPSSWGNPEFESVWSSPDWAPGPHYPNAGEYLNWYYLPFGIDPDDPDSIVVVQWHFVEGKGMVLYFGYSYDEYFTDPKRNTTFVNVTESLGAVTWTYSFHDVVGGENFFRVTLIKCIP